MATYPNDIIDDQLRKLGERDAEIADLKRQLSEANEKLEEQEGWLHSCPVCGMKCKECECMQNQLTASRERERRLRGILEFLRLYEMEPAARNIIDVALRDTTESEAKHAND